VSAARERSLLLTADLLRLYSRRGNYHSDPEAAADIGYTRLVAQGMQVAGPAYGLLLDEWGDDFLTHGSIDLKFVGMVVDGETADATVTTSAADSAELVVNVGDRTAVVGTAARNREAE
jgi:acyl dehydratase